ncbi:MAG: cytochrome c-type biogenesis protein [Thermodesulfobacteriota bacterium]
MKRVYIYQKFLSLFFFFLLFALIAYSNTIDDTVMDIAGELLCPVCQGQSVSESNSALAQDMRTTIRSKLKEGQSKEEIINYFRKSYGDTILASPPLKGFNVFLWILPFISLSIGAFIIIRVLKNYKKPVVEKVNSSEPDPEYIEMIEKEIKESS